MKLVFSLKMCRGRRNFRFSATMNSFPTGIFGPSGAGKSTLLHLLAGLLKPGEGMIQVDSKVLFDSERSINLPPHQRRIGIVHQDGLLFPHMTIAANLRYGLKRQTSSRISFDDVVDVLELADVLGQNAQSVSGGERQRAALGRAILAEPRLLLCDEPLASVDERLKWKILPFLANAIRHFQIPTIYVSHNQREITAISRQLAIMQDGSIIAHGQYHDIIDQSSVYELFTREKIENALEGTLLETDMKAGFSRVQIQDTQFLVPPAIAEAGSPVILSLKANDVILSRRKPEEISTRNTMQGRIMRLTNVHGVLMVHVDVGCNLLVELTPSAQAELTLQQGDTVWILIKTNSFRVAVGRRI